MMSSRMLAAIGLLGVMLGAAGCREPVADVEPIRPVRAVRVGDLNVFEGREFPGRASAKDSVDLSFQVSGPLVSLPVDVGSEVKQGDVIASIDLRDFQTALDSAQGNLDRARSNLLAMERGARPEDIERLKADLEQAQASDAQATAELTRFEELVGSGAVSKSEYDVRVARAQRTAAEVKSAMEALKIGESGARPEDIDAKRAEIKSLEATVTAAKNQLDYATLKSPFSGSVAATHLDELLVTPRFSSRAVPVLQVIDGIAIPWDDPLIWRWDRRRAITVQCSPNGVTAPTLRDAVLDEFEAIDLPPGYRLDWDGEYWSAKQSQAALVPGIVPAIVMMLFLLVALFNEFRPMLICILVIPFVMIGITGGLLLTSTPFGFIALLGAMSLSGMMIKNAVVLLDQVKANLAVGMAPYPAVVEGAVSRLSPVINAAGTTVLGVLPMLQDVFWVALAVTIFFGLIVGTMLTMVMVPTLYALFYLIQKP